MAKKMQQKGKWVMEKELGPKLEGPRGVEPNQNSQESQNQ